MFRESEMIVILVTHIIKNEISERKNTDNKP
jgi:hypothetical protein